MTSPVLVQSGDDGGVGGDARVVLQVGAWGGGGRLASGEQLGPHQDYLKVLVEPLSARRARFASAGPHSQ